MTSLKISDIPPVRPDDTLLLPPRTATHGSQAQFSALLASPANRNLVHPRRLSFVNTPTVSIATHAQAGDRVHISSASIYSHNPPPTGGYADQDSVAPPIECNMPISMRTPMRVGGRTYTGSNPVTARNITRRASSFSFEGTTAGGSILPQSRYPCASTPYSKQRHFSASLAGSPTLKSHGQDATDDVPTLVLGHHSILLSLAENSPFGPVSPSLKELHPIIRVSNIADGTVGHCPSHTQLVEARTPHTFAITLSPPLESNGQLQFHPSAASATDTPVQSSAMLVSGPVLSLPKEAVALQISVLPAVLTSPDTTVITVLASPSYFSRSQSVPTTHTISISRRRKTSKIARPEMLDLVRYNWLLFQQMHGVVSLLVCSAIWSIFMVQHVKIAAILVIALPVRFDPFVDGVSIACFIIFVLEWLLECMTRELYIFGFQWFLDTLFLLSLFPSLPLIWNPLTDALGVSDVANSHQLALLNSNRPTVSALRLVLVLYRTRVIRVVRLLDQCEPLRRRLVDWWFGYSRGELESDHAVVADGCEPNDRNESGSESEDDMPETPCVTVVGRQFANRASQRIVLAFLILLFVLSILLTVDRNYSNTMDLRLLHSATLDMRTRSSDGAALEYFESTIAFILQQPSVMFMVVNTTNASSLYIQLAGLNQLRYDEVSRLIVKTLDLNTEIWFSLHEDLVLNRTFSLTLLCIFMAVLILVAVLFFIDTNLLIVTPIERMVAFVKQLASNPLGKIRSYKHFNGADDAALASGFEPVLLESTLRKIGSLVQVSFGAAGAETISKNMHGDRLECMVPGLRVDAIYGFCDIRQFTEATECLNGRIMAFVNAVAAIVHAAAHRTGGAANKNIGDAFLLVWKFPDPVFNWIDHPVPPPFSAHRVADRALMGVLQLLEEIAVSPTLSVWRFCPEILARIPDFSLRLGIGLHAGFSIEGALGSRMKIDASYLSTNVNLCVILEEYTKVYQVPLLFSGEFYDLLSPSVQLRCRWLDSVSMSSRIEPLDLFTFDLSKAGVVQLRRSSLGLEDSLDSNNQISSITPVLNIRSPRFQRSASASEPLLLERTVGVRHRRFQRRGGGENGGKTYYNEESNETVMTPMSIAQSQNSATIELVEVYNARKPDLPPLIPGLSTIGLSGTMTQPCVSTKRLSLDYMRSGKSDGFPSLQIDIHPAFVQSFNDAVQFYIAGDWKTAKRLLENTQKMMPSDATTILLLQRMKESDFEAPGSWQGFFQEKYLTNH